MPEHADRRGGVKAPNGGNRQWGLFRVTDRAKIREFATLYHEAWWVKRLPATRADFTLTAAEHMVIPAVPLTGSLHNPHQELAELRGLRP